MPEQEVDEKLLKADRWSKIIALFFAMGMYGVAVLLTPDLRFNASVAAFGAIGVRIYIPYQVSISGRGPESVPSQAHPQTGNYHHGAVGGALVLGSFVALGVMAVEPSFMLAFGGGVAVAVASFLLLRVVLPSG